MAARISFPANQRLNAGETINGTLSLRVPRTVQARRLEIEFRGEEYAKIRVREGTLVYNVTDWRQIVRINIPANDVNEVIRQNGWKLPSGIYEIPFSIRMPANLPASAFFGDFDDKAKIEYCLRAKVDGSDIACQQVLVHAQADPIQTIPRSVPPKLHEIRFLKLSKQGLAAVGARVDDSLLIPGQRVRLDLAIDNVSGATIRNIRVVLREIVFWKAQGHTYYTDRAKHIVGVSRKTSAQLKKLNPELLEENRRDLNRKERSLQKISEQLTTRDGLISLLLPPIPHCCSSNIRNIPYNSHRGSLLTVCHELKVTLETKRWCSNPTLYIPVKIARGQGSGELPVARIARIHEVPVATSVEPLYNDDDLKSYDCSYHWDSLLEGPALEEWSEEVSI